MKVKLNNFYFNPKSLLDHILVEGVDDEIVSSTNK